MTTPGDRRCRGSGRVNADFGDNAGGGALMGGVVIAAVPRYRRGGADNAGMAALTRISALTRAGGCVIAGFCDNGGVAALTRIPRYRGWRGVNAGFLR